MKLIHICKSLFPYDHVAVSKMSLRQARWYIGDSCDKWKHLLKDVTDTFDHAKQYMDWLIGRFEMSSTFPTVSSPWPLIRWQLRSQFLMAKGFCLPSDISETQNWSQCNSERYFYMSTTIREFSDRSAIQVYNQWLIGQIRWKEVFRSVTSWLRMYCRDYCFRCFWVDI